MQTFTFDRKEFRIPNFSSVDAFATLIAHGEHLGFTAIAVEGPALEIFEEKKTPAT